MAAACISITLPEQRAIAADNVEVNSPLIGLLKNFLPGTPEASSPTEHDALDAIAWDAPKRRGMSIEEMADAIDVGLREREWFVTGRSLPQYFSDQFTFADPDVSLNGIEAYSRAVRRLFDQETARCELVCCSATAPNTINVVWRNSGRVNIGPLGFELKPYIVTTTLKTDLTDGLIVSQRDEFVADGPGLLLYQVPALRSLAAPAAPGVDVLRQSYSCPTKSAE